MITFYKKKRIVLLFFGFILASIAAYGALLYWQAQQAILNTEETIAPEKTIATEKIALEPNQFITAIHVTNPKKGLVIYISDSSSPEITPIYAKKIAELSYYVANIESKFLLSPLGIQKNACLNIAEKLTAIAQQLQIKYSLNADELPILVGNAAGAALVYTALAQANSHSFHAGISIDFTPSIENNTPPCSVNNFSNTPPPHIQFTPTKHLAASWYIFQTSEYAQNTTSNAFIAHNNNAKLTSTGSQIDSMAAAIQILQWLDPRLTDQILSSNSDGDLPLIEVAAIIASASNPHPNQLQDTMALLLTGDGGWAEIDKNVANKLAEKGIPTIAIDSLSYFWRARTPAETANDIENVIQQYRKQWNKKKVILIGYSFGADVLPFIANRLSEHTKTDIKLIALLAMGKTAAFEFRLSSWINADTSAARLPVMPELENMKWANSLCIYGLDDDATACTGTAHLGIKIISMSGDHHFDKKYDELVQHIIQNIP